MSQIRETTVTAQSTETFGRLVCSTRNHHFVVDGPVQNSCPGEALTPPELFLSAVLACGVELTQVIAKEDGLPIPNVKATIYGKVDRGNPVRSDFTVFNEVHLTFSMTNVSNEVARSLVERFQRRCPLFGTVAVATPVVKVEVSGSEK